MRSGKTGKREGAREEKKNVGWLPYPSISLFTAASSVARSHPIRVFSSTLL